MFINIHWNANDKHRPQSVGRHLRRSGGCERRPGGWRTENPGSASAPPDGPTLPPAGQETHQRLATASAARLSHLAGVHDQDAVRVGHGVDAVGDGEHGAVPEGFLDGVLDQSVRLGVDGRRRLVQKDNLEGNHTEQVRRRQVKATPNSITITVFTGL